MSYTENLAKYVRYKREQNGWSLNKFAIEAEIESSTLSRNETCFNDFNIETLIKIAGVYNQTLSEFLKDFEEYDKTNS